MNFNIALNTIIYIMVFLFPGALFRRFYFSGKASKQFNQGNLLERFLWTLFVSVISLIICGLIFYAIDNWLQIPLLHDITFNKILNIFESLSKNEFPDTFKDKKDVKNLGIIVSFIYIISSLAGILIIRFVRLFSLDAIIDILRFSDEWQYLTRPYRKHGIKRQLGDVHVPYVDILVSHKEKDELYKGIVKDFITDKENKLENIVIANSQKFIQLKVHEDNEKIESLRRLCNVAGSGYRLHRESNDKVVFVKDISGHLFVLPNQNIVNINFTYVKISNVLIKWKKILLTVMFFILYISAIFIVIFPFLKIDSTYFLTLPKKIIFSISTLFACIFLIGGVQSMVLKESSDKIGTAFMFFLLSIIPYLWLFDYFNGWGTAVVFVIVFLIIGMILSRNDSQNAPSDNAE